MSSPHIKRKTAFNLSYDNRYAKPLVRTGTVYLTGSLARSDSKETHVSCHKRAKHASQFSRGPIPCYNSFDGKSNADQDYEADSDFQTMAPGISALRAKAIEFLFVHIYKSPPKTEWRQLNLLPTIMRTLQIPD